MPLIFNNFQRGQSQSPYTSDGAFAKAVNLDIFSQEGIARINYLPIAPTIGAGGAIQDLIRSFTRYSGSATSFAAADDSNYAYVIDPTTSPHTVSGITSPNPTIGKYVLHWKGYLLGFATANLKYNNSGTWTNLAGSPTFSVSNANHPYLASKNDGKVYFLAGNKVDTLTEATTFDPTSAPTFTFTQGAFTIPSDYQGFGLAELGRYIIIAAVNVTTSLAENANPVTTYFFWDRSKTTADNIIELPEKRMTNLLGVGSEVFISGGNQGKIYKLSESGLQFYAQIPFDYDNGKTVNIGGLGYPSMAWWRNMLLVGVSNDSATGLNPVGIYGIKNGRVCHQFLPSENLDGSTKQISIGAIYPYDETTFYFGWKNATDSTKGLDKVSTTNNRRVSYGSYFESQLIPVGTKDSKKSFDKIEVVLSRPLQTGEGIRISYRQDISTSYTVLQTKDYSTEGAVMTIDFAGIHNLVNLQLKVELTTGASSQNTPYLLEVRCL